MAIVMAGSKKRKAFCEENVRRSDWGTSRDIIVKLIFSSRLARVTRRRTGIILYANAYTYHAARNSKYYYFIINARILYVAVGKSSTIYRILQNNNSDRTMIFT